MSKIAILKIASFALLIFLGPSSQASEEQVAAKATGKALLRTPAGRQASKELEKMLQLHRLPKPIQQVGPIITLIVDKKISYKWEF